MARDGAVYVCQVCGAAQAKWAGQCPACNAWNSLVEEVQIHLVPVVFGAGTRMFEDVGRLDLETVEAVRTERATHLRFRLDRSS